MEAVLGFSTVDEQADSTTASGWYSGPSTSSSSSSALPASEAQLAALPTDMLCTVVWACGQLRHADTRLLQAATVLLHGRVDDMAPADMTRCGAGGWLCNRGGAGGACFTRWLCHLGTSRRACSMQ